MRRLSAVFLAVSLAGCATSPPEASSVKSVAALAWYEPTANSGTLIVTRDAGFTGSGCIMHVFLDGAPIGDLRTSERITVYPAAGEHIAGVKACTSDDEKSLTVASGETKRYRVAIGNGMELKIEPTAF
jgi:hypothetical protein